MVKVNINIPLIFSLGLLIACQTSDAPVDTRPNILFAFADDMGKYASSYAKLDGPESINALIRTPHMDRIASEGVLFANAFVNAPSCTPCRSSILSGQHFFRTGLGAILQGAIWADTIPTYPKLLAEAGYHTGFTYKVWSPGTPRDAGYGGEEYKYQLAGKFNQFSQNVYAYLEEGDISIDSAKSRLYDEVRGNFAAFLDDQEEGKPFCYWWGPTNVHRKWIYGSGEKLWNLDPDKFEGRLPPFVPDVDTVRTDFADYLGEVMAFDAGLGIILEMLEERGELDNTLIVVSGDHGFPGMSNGKCNLYDFGVQVPLMIRWPEKVAAGRTVDDLVMLPDLAPTFLDAAKIDIPSVMTARSLMPLLTAAASGQIDASRDHVITGRERHVRLARAGALPYPQRALRTQDHLYIINFAPDRYPMGDPLVVDDTYQADINELTNNTFHAFGDYDGSPSKAWIVNHRKDPSYAKYFEFAFGKRPAEELFDLIKDPHQINNLATNPAFDEIRKKMRTELISKLNELGDPRVRENPVSFEFAPYAGQ